MLKVTSLPHSKSWLAACLVAAIVGVICVIDALTPEGTVQNIIGLSSSPAVTSPAIAPEVIREQVEWARSESLKRLEGHFGAIDELFQQARTHEFADTCLGWESKWLLAKDQFTNAGEHPKFIKDAFRRSVLDGDQLQRVLQQCIAAYQQELDSIDGEFYVRLEIDRERLPESNGVVAGMDGNSAHQMQIVQGAISASQSDLPEWIAREAVSWAVSEVTSSMLLSLGTATGVISEKDAKSGWKPFATNVAVGLAVDQAISEATDPVGKLQAVINRQLAGLRTAVLDGSAEAPGVLPRLRAYAETRSEARRESIQSIVSGVATVSTSNSSF